MGMFSNLLTKVFGHSTKAVPAPTTATKPATDATAASAGAALGSASATTTPSAGSSDPASPAPAPQKVDVTAVLDGLAAKNPEKLDWRKSIVDLLKLVDMDSSLSARKELAAELKFSGDASDSAKLNVWLHKEVIKQIAANGGTVPANLLD